MRKRFTKKRRVIRKKRRFNRRRRGGKKGTKYNGINYYKCTLEEIPFPDTGA